MGYAELLPVCGMLFGRLVFAAFRKGLVTAGSFRWFFHVRGFVDSGRLLLFQSNTFKYK